MTHPYDESPGASWTGADEAASRQEVRLGVPCASTFCPNLRMAGRDYCAACYARSAAALSAEQIAERVPLELVAPTPRPTLRYGIEGDDTRKPGCIGSVVGALTVAAVFVAATWAGARALEWVAGR
jgi:hypothetical protein